MEVSFLLCFLTLLPSSVYATINGLSLLEKPRFEAIYQFGDSIADTGNIVREDVHCNSGRLPYGQTFFHHSTGRFSDGRLMIDFFAQALDLPFLDPYLDKEGNFTHGVNFAVAGATALNVSTLAEKNIHIAPSVTRSSLLVQLDWFKAHLNALHSTPSERKEKLGNALFLVGEIGGNDYNYAVSQVKTMDDLRALVPEIIQTIIDVTEELIDLGAKRLIIPGNFPTGCMTICLAFFKTNDPKIYDELNCVRSWNEFSMFHNDRLQSAIKGLQKNHSDVVIVYGDYYAALTSILKHASSLGFEEAELLKACCGSGANDYNFDIGKQCGSKEASVCSNPTKRVSWDGVHLTEHAYQLMADWLLKHIMNTTLFENNGRIPLGNAKISPKKSSKYILEEAQTSTACHVKQAVSDNKGKACRTKKIGEEDRKVARSDRATMHDRATTAG